MIELTDEQVREVQRCGQTPPTVVDPKTNTPYVLIRKDVYERLAELLEGEFHPSEAYPAIDHAFAEGWNDPKMDDYDRYEELKR